MLIVQDVAPYNDVIQKHNKQWQDRTFELKHAVSDTYAVPAVTCQSVSQSQLVLINHKAHTSHTWQQSL